MITSLAGDPSREGKAVPNVSPHQVTVSLTLSDLSRLQVTVIARYLSRQFADYLNTQPIADFVVVDLLVREQLSKHWGKGDQRARMSPGISRGNARGYLNRHHADSGCGRSGEGMGGGRNTQSSSCAILRRRKGHRRLPYHRTRRTSSYLRYVVTGELFRSRPEPIAPYTLCRAGPNLSTPGLVCLSVYWNTLQI